MMLEEDKRNLILRRIYIIESKIDMEMKYYTYIDTWKRKLRDGKGKKEKEKKR